MRADGEICVMAKPSESSVFAFVNPEMVMFVPAPSGTFGTRVAVMVFDKLCSRIQPPMSEEERADLLLKKIPYELHDIATSIEAQIEATHGGKLVYSGPTGAKSLYIKLATKRASRMRAV